MDGRIRQGLRSGLTKTRSVGRLCSLETVSYFSNFSSPEQKAQDEPLLSLPVRRPSTTLNDFSTETPGPVFFKRHEKPSVKAGLKTCIK